MSDVVLGIIGILIIALGLIISVALHEVGHMVPAKLFGVRVTQYMVGFGPTVFSRKRGDTEYGFKAIPAGGYVKMVGMYPPARSKGFPMPRYFRRMVEEAREYELSQLSAADHRRSFYQLAPPKKLVVMLGGPVMNLVLGVLILFITAMSFSQPHPTTAVDQVSQCVPPAASKQNPNPKCTPEAPASPALQAGLRPDDRIVAIAGRPVTDWEQLTTAIERRAGQRVNLTVERDGQRKQLATTLVDQPGGKHQGFLGIVPQSVDRYATPGEAASKVTGTLGSIFGIVGHLPQRVYDIGQVAFGQEERDQEGLVGVIGVGRIGNEVASTDRIDVGVKAAILLNLLGTLNFALFVFNLLPLLPLDGGHVLGGIIEWIRRALSRFRRKPDPGAFDTASLLPVAYGVFVLLIGMSLLVAYVDIVNPIRLFNY